MKPSTILKKARKLIEKGWCKNYYATTSKGQIVSLQHRSAAKFCARGAIYRVMNLSAQWEATEPEVWLAKALAGPYHTDDAAEDVANFNNTQRNKRPVLAAFTRAIALAEKEGR